MTGAQAEGVEAVSMVAGASGAKGVLEAEHAGEARVVDDDGGLAFLLNLGNALAETVDGKRVAQAAEEVGRAQDGGFAIDEAAQTHAGLLREFLHRDHGDAGGFGGLQDRGSQRMRGIGLKRRGDLQEKVFGIGLAVRAGWCSRF